MDMETDKDMNNEFERFIQAKQHKDTAKVNDQEIITQEIITPDGRKITRRKLQAQKTMKLPLGQEQAGKGWKLVNWLGAELVL